MKTSVALMRRSRFLQTVHLSAVSFPHREDSVRMEVTAGHLGNWKGLLEGVLPNVSDVVEPLWRRRPLYVRRPPTNNSMKLTVWSAASRAVALAAVGQPAAYAHR